MLRTALLPIIYWTSLSSTLFSSLYPLTYFFSIFFFLAHKLCLVHKVCDRPTLVSISFISKLLLTILWRDFILFHSFNYIFGAACFQDRPVSFSLALLFLPMPFLPTVDPKMQDNARCAPQRPFLRHLPNWVSRLPLYSEPSPLRLKQL